MKKISITILLTLITGCSSYHNLKTDGRSVFGGGFYDTELDEGLFELTAKTNFSPWVNYKDAHITFKKRASELCSNEYSIIQTKESYYDSTGSNHIISQVDGYVLCKNSPVTMEQAKTYVKPIESL